ncbi:phage GP46 family protein [Acetobacter orientalis]|uniref:phage GP46 family protein n=1 Tax=Acetobacter orientalis TaxID=146474 RepID=UPI00209DA296|nr:phage GP46 family protein [Acetobacter orientalis]MCP1216812.1 phage GP46 family protein [Acetobacter orientalis]MCP1219539.1 phage GP46 family protein [Acetobacter orientalis]
MDIALAWDVTRAECDWVIKNGDLALDSSLRSAVLVSLFTDRVAPETLSALDAAVGLSAVSGAAGGTTKDIRGWWADAWAETPIGSRLWQLQRAIKSGQTSLPREVEAICYEALQWLVDDGVAQSVVVAAQFSTTNRQAIEFTVTVQEPGRNTPQVFLFSWAWEGL